MSEGLNMPASWDAFNNPPAQSAIRMANPPGTSIEVPCGTDLTGGAINLFNNIYTAQPLASAMYRIAFSTTDAGGAGTYNFLFTSGPCSNFFQNKWSRSNIAFTGVNVNLNSVETYYFCNTAGSGIPSGCVDWGNTNITLNSSKFYTANFPDNGYNNTSAIFFETSALPVSILSVSSAYDNTASACNGAGGLIVTVNCSGSPVTEEKVFVRYSTSSNFSTSTFAPVVFADTTQPAVGKAVIPFTANATIYYYALSTTLTAPALNAYNTSTSTDAVTLMANTNGGANYSYTFSSATSATNALSGYYLIDNTANTYFPNSFAFASLTTAINALSSNGVCGPVVIQIPGGFTETAPSSGFVIQYGSGVPVSDQTKPVMIRKKGTAGNHPLLTAWNNSTGIITAGSTTSGDGIFKVVGGDYISIDKVDLQENSLNTAAGPWMEYGYALLKENATNGSQHCTISNCAITLSKLNNTSSGTTGNEAGSTGIASLNTSNSSSANVVVTSSTGANSYNKFTGNVVKNCFNGIVMKGYNAPSPYSLYDQNNHAGGSTAAAGNTIQNYAGSGSVQAYGIYMIYQKADSVSYNTIDNVAGGGTAHTHVIYGVFHSTGTNSSVYIGNNTISVAKSTNNNDLVAIRSSISGSGKVDVVNNTITNCTSAGGSNPFYGIYMASSAVTQNITGNSIINNTAVNTTGSAFLVYTNNSSGTIINVNSNTISSFTKTGIGNTIYGYYNATGSSGGSETISGNTFSSITGTGATHVYAIYSVAFTVASQDGLISDNVISGFSSNGTSSTIMMGIDYQRTNNSKSLVISGNDVGTFSGGATMTGIFGSVSSAGSNKTSILSNVVHDISSSVGDIIGIRPDNSDQVVGLNTIYALTSNVSKTAKGIYFTGYLDINCYQNKIYNVTAYGANGAAYGMYDDNSASDHDYYNNIIGDIKAPESTLANGACGFMGGVNMSPPIRLYNNTFYLNTTSTGTNFGSAAVYVTTNGFAYTSLFLKNNIIVNLSTPNGTGITSALRTTNTNLSSYQTSSNNNLFYAGSPSASRVLFFNGTTGYQDITSFKTAVGPTRESNSNSALPDFLNTSSGSASDYLHINPSGPNVSYVDMKALPIVNEIGWYNNSLSISIDYDGDTRDAVNPDIGADEITLVILPIELSYFDVTTDGVNAYLEWNTASEYNSSYFSVERSTDATHFEEIGKLSAMGFIAYTSTYAFTDADIEQLGVRYIYYRLRMIDLDQSFEYTEVKMVEITTESLHDALLVYPNPFSENVNIIFHAYEASPAVVQVVNAVGQTILEKQVDISAGVNTISVNEIFSMSAGIYLLNIRMGTVLLTQRLVKSSGTF